MVYGVGHFLSFIYTFLIIHRQFEVCFDVWYAQQLYAMNFVSIDAKENHVIFKWNGVRCDINHFYCAKCFSNRVCLCIFLFRFVSFYSNSCCNFFQFAQSFSMLPLKHTDKQWGWHSLVKSLCTVENQVKQEYRLCIPLSRCSMHI